MDYAEWRELPVRVPAPWAERAPSPTDEFSGMMSYIAGPVERVIDPAVARAIDAMGLGRETATDEQMPAREMWADIEHSENWADLAAEVRADEHAALVRDLGEADAAIYGGRVAEAHRLREIESGSPGTPPHPMSDVEQGRAVADVEASWRSPTPSVPRGDEESYDRILDRAAARAANDNSKDRGGPER